MGPPDVAACRGSPGGGKIETTGITKLAGGSSNRIRAPERIRQLETKALAKLRHPEKAKNLQGFLENG